MKPEEQEKTAFDPAGLDALEAEVLSDITEDSAKAGAVDVGGFVQPVDEEMKALVGGLLGMGFAVLAPNWEVRPQEVEQLTEAYSALLCKYCPDGLGEYGVEISAVMITFAVVAPRLSMPRDKPEKQEGAAVMPDVLTGEAA